MTAWFSALRSQTGSHARTRYVVSLAGPSCFFLPCSCLILLQILSRYIKYSPDRVPPGTENMA